MTDTAKRAMGFNVISCERRVEIARMGGRAAHARGVAHRWDQAEAHAASRLGVVAKLKKRQAREEEDR